MNDSAICRQWGAVTGLIEGRGSMAAPVCPPSSDTEERRETVYKTAATPLPFPNFPRLCVSFLMRRNQGQFKREHVAVRGESDDWDGTAKRRQRRGGQTGRSIQMDMENLVGNQILRNLKPHTNYRICQYLLVYWQCTRWLIMLFRVFLETSFWKSMVLSPFYIQDLEVSPCTGPHS